MATKNDENHQRTFKKYCFDVQDLKKILIFKSCSINGRCRGRGDKVTFFVERYRVLRIQFILVRIRIPVKTFFYIFLPSDFANDINLYCRLKEVEYWLFFVGFFLAELLRDWSFCGGIGTKYCTYVFDYLFRLCV
jgi:hypothetical protein